VEVARLEQVDVCLEVEICIRELCLAFTGAYVLSFSVAGVGEICCVAELDSPPQQKWTRPVRAGSAGIAAEMEWNEELFL